MSGVYSVTNTPFPFSNSAEISNRSLIESDKTSQQADTAPSEKEELDIGLFSFLEAVATPPLNPDKRTLETTMTLAGYFQAMTYQTDERPTYALHLLSTLRGIRCPTYIETLIEHCEQLEKGSTQILYHLLFRLHDHLGVKHPSLHHCQLAFVGDPSVCAQRNATHQEQIEVVKRAQALELLKGIQVAFQLDDQESLHKQLDQLNSIQFDRNLPNLNPFTHLENQIINYLLNPQDKNKRIDFEKGQQILRGKIEIDHLTSDHKKAAVNCLESELRKFWLPTLSAPDKQ